MHLFTKKFVSKVLSHSLWATVLGAGVFYVFAHESEVQAVMKTPVKHYVLTARMPTRIDLHWWSDKGPVFHYCNVYPGAQALVNSYDINDSNLDQVQWTVVTNSPTEQGDLCAFGSSVSAMYYPREWYVREATDADLCYWVRENPDLVSYPGTASHPGHASYPYPASHPGSASYPYPSSYPSSGSYPYPSSYPGSSSYPRPSSYPYPSSYPSSGSYPYPSSYPGSSSYPYPSSYPRPSSYPSSGSYPYPGSYPSAYGPEYCRLVR